MARKTTTKPPSQPGEAELAATLGIAKKHWDALHSHVRASKPKARAEWKFYKSAGAGGGWRNVMSDGKRNLLYLRPDAGSFLVSCALSDVQVDAAEKAGLDPEVVLEIRRTAPTGEGRAARMVVRAAADVASAKRLFDAKAGVPRLRRAEA